MGPQGGRLRAPSLEMAVGSRRPDPEQLLIHHSDRGQYTSVTFTEALDDHGVLRSVGSIGDAYDNAMAESFVDTLKTELLADRVWRTHGQLELAIVEWIGWYNTRCRTASSATSRRSSTSSLTPSPARQPSLDEPADGSAAPPRPYRPRLRHAPIREPHHRLTPPDDPASAKPSPLHEGLWSVVIRRSVAAWRFDSLRGVRLGHHGYLACTGWQLPRFGLLEHGRDQRPDPE